MYISNMQNYELPPITVYSAIDFYQKLKAIDISVPLNDEDREIWEREQYCGIRFAATFVEERCEFPVSIIHQDRPDYSFESNNGRDVGLEISEVRSKRDTSKCKDGFAGNEPEKYWSELFPPAIQKKTEKLKNYTKYPRNYLLLYSNTVRVEGKKTEEASDLSQIGLNMDIAIKFLIEKLNDVNYWESATNPPYDKIFIEHNRHFFELTNSSQRRKEIKDFWN